MRCALFGSFQNFDTADDWQRLHLALGSTDDADESKNAEDKGEKPEEPGNHQHKHRTDVFKALMFDSFLCLKICSYAFYDERGLSSIWADLQVEFCIHLYSLDNGMGRRTVFGLDGKCIAYGACKRFRVYRLVPEICLRCEYSP